MDPQGGEQEETGITGHRRDPGRLAGGMALHYFATSEQLLCQVHLAAGPTPSGWRAGALILEKVAGAGGIDPALGDAEQAESWRTATTLASTLTDEELLDDTLASDRLLYRLFHSEGVAADRARALSFGCRCSRARLASILEGFPADDLDHMAIDDDIVMTCEFCNYDFRFPRHGVHGKASKSKGPSPAPPAATRSDHAFANKDLTPLCNPDT